MPSTRIIHHVAWGAFIVAALTYVVRGGMWLDEMQVWCLARDSGSITQLFQNMQLEGHPPLWHLLVWGITRFVHDPQAMAFVHALFAIGTAYLIIYRSDLPTIWRILIVFGYFVLFEYTAIARNYGPGVFFIFLASDAYRSQRHQVAVLALIALAFVHYWGITVASAFAFVQLLSRHQSTPIRTLYALVLVSAAVALYISIPSAQLGYKPSFHHFNRSTLFIDLERIFGQVFLPFPDLASERPWNTNWILDRWPHVHGMLGIACLVLSLWCIALDRKWLAFYVIVTLGIIAFPLFAPFHSVRYVGPVFIAFIVALLHTEHTRWRVPIISFILAMQVPGALAMFIENIGTPRSMAQRTVTFIAHSEFSTFPITVHPYQLAPAISGYADHSVWNFSTEALESYCKWDSGPFRLNDEDLFPALTRTPYHAYLLVTDKKGLAERTTDDLVIIELTNFSGAMITSEEHVVYFVHRYR